MRLRGAILISLALLVQLESGCPGVERAAPAGAGRKTDAAASASASISPSVRPFVANVEAYVKATEALRKEAEAKSPEGDTPEKQAEAVEKKRATLAAGIRALRPAAKPGELFTHEGAAQIVRQLDAALGGPGSATIRDAFEEQNDP